ncbi:MAG: hypothetical protein R2774_11890 [Saprospiraceae bacterium]
MSRFGVKDGKVNPLAKAGEYIAKYGKMISNNSIKGLRIRSSPYFFHEHWGSSDKNYVCLAMMSSVWKDFKNFVTQVG